jgi:hypothetical protein
MHKKTISPLFRSLVLAGVAAAIVSHTASTAAARENVSWSPRVTERLVKLPGNFVKKAVENDFARSGLAEELANVADQMNIKRETLIELKEAIESAEGELRLELEHQLVSEKRSFINLMRDHQKIRRKKTETKIRLYSGLLKKLKNTENSATPGASALMQRQKAAKQRFEKTLSEVDKKIISSSSPVGSRYAQEYEKNLAAIGRLSEAFKTHPMNRSPEILGNPVSSSEYLRQLLSENQGEIALLNQEAKILSFMAKLVSLDALSIADRAMENDPNSPSGVPSEDTTPATTIDLFIPNNV